MFIIFIFSYFSFLKSNLERCGFQWSMIVQWWIYIIDGTLFKLPRQLLRDELLLLEILNFITCNIKKKMEHFHKWWNGTLWSQMITARFYSVQYGGGHSQGNRLGVLREFLDFNCIIFTRDVSLLGSLLARGLAMEWWYWQFYNSGCVKSVHNFLLDLYLSHRHISLSLLGYNNLVPFTN